MRPATETLAQRIDRELASNRVLQSGLPAYAAILDRYEATRRRDGLEAEIELCEAIVELAARQYRETAGQDVELLTFSDGANDCLFDATNGRTVMMYGLSKKMPANSRDDSYHRGYSSLAGYDKGHALSHAQGGREGGPNYFRQRPMINRPRSEAGKLWRAVETYLAANEGLRAFVRLIYAPRDPSHVPVAVEYALLAQRRQFRSVIFPNV